MSTTWKLSKYLTQTDAVVKDASGNAARLTFASRTGRSLLITEPVWQALKAGLWNTLEEKTTSALRAAKILVPEHENEFETVWQENSDQIARSKVLSLTLQPTADCQLGCGYCGQSHTKKIMDDATAERLVNRVIDKLRRSGLNDLSLNWYGGEPLMAYSRILEISDRLINFCDANQIQYRAGMITNGMSFKPAVFEQLAERRIRRFQITLDGLANTHDIMRITKQGHGSFDIILKNLFDVIHSEAYERYQATINVRVNISRPVAKNVTKLIDLLAENGAAQKRITLHFAPIFDWGGNAADKTLGLDAEEFAAAEIDWIMHAQHRGFVFDDILPGRTKIPCMVVMNEAEVYDAYGNIFPCYEFPYTEKYDRPEYKIGTLDGPRENENPHAVTRDWMQDVKNGGYPCRDCELYPVCGGACPKSWHENGNGCPQFKANIQDRLVLSYLNARKHTMNGMQVIEAQEKQEQFQHSR